MRRFIACLILSALLAPGIAGAASVAEEIAAKNRQIEELERQIAEFQRQADEAGAQSRTLEVEVRKLNAQIGQLTAQIRSLEAGIERTDLEISQTEEQIAEAERRIVLHQEALGDSLRETARADEASLAEILLRHEVLSQFYDYLHAVQRTQDTVRLAIRSIRELRVQLDEKSATLEEEQADLERMKALQEVQQRSLASTKGKVNSLLQETKGQESRYQKLIATTKKDLERIREQINYLVASGVSVEDAVAFANLAAIGAGIRPAFLLALLEVESRLGQNVGKGNWKDDMYECYLRLAGIARTADRKAYYRKRAEDEKNAFFAVIGKLGLDPASVKVSKEPSYGCGGAMGPAQFIPTTWLGYEAEVMRITGHNPVSPWNFQDAFTASAIKLARGGATSKDRAGEVRAAKAYISGNASCSTATCNNYANTILKKAADIEADL